jgi:hypothetical protein
MRFQWRCAQVSDLYIVYTKNAYPTSLIKNPTTLYHEPYYNHPYCSHN